MDTNIIPDYVYTRAGETFTVGPWGIRCVDAGGAVLIDRKVELPADVIAATVVDLALAGWAPVD
jgi:hypothetical protein